MKPMNAIISYTSYIPQIMGLGVLAVGTYIHFKWDRICREHRQQEKKGEYKSLDAYSKYYPYLVLGAAVFTWLCWYMGKFILWETSLFTKSIGLSLCLLGLYLFERSHADLNVNWMPVVAKVKDQELCQTGLYAYIRNPMYSGIMCTYTGLMLLTGASWAIYSVIVSAGVVYYRVPAEDMLMKEMFGQKYETWKRKTWAMVPYVF